jgi:hypothetical protein
MITTKIPPVCPVVRDYFASNRAVTAAFRPVRPGPVRVFFGALARTAAAEPQL